MDRGRPHYKELSLQYELARPPAVSVEGAETVWGAARLTVEYPHPDGRPESARATLQLSGATEGCDCPDDEVWALDLSTDELNQTIAALAGAAPGATGPASLTFRTDRRQIETRCPPDPALDALIERIQCEGCLSGYIAAREPITLAAADHPRPVRSGPVLSHVPQLH